MKICIEKADNKNQTLSFLTKMIVKLTHSGKGNENMYRKGRQHTKH